MKKVPATRKVLRVLLIAIVLAFVAVLFGIVPFNAGFLRGPIEDAVHDATGLQLSIGDRIMLRLGPAPSVTSGGLVIGDPAISPLLVVDSLHARIGLFALLGDRVHVRELTAHGVRIDYCGPLPDVPGNSNEDTAPPSITVDTVEVSRIAIRCGPVSQPDPFQLDVTRASGAAPADGPIQLNVEGSLTGATFTLTATGGKLDQLLKGLERYPVDISLESAAATVEVTGSLRTPPADVEVDARFEVGVTDVEALADAFGFGLPAVGMLRAKGSVRGDSRTMELVEVTGELGESRFAFDAAVDSTHKRERVDLTATLEQLDLAPFLDEPPAAQRPDQAAERRDVDLRPALDMLNAVDADVQLTVTRVLGSPVELGGVALTAGLADGIVELQPMTVELLGGHMSGTGSFDSQSACPELKLLVHGSGLDLASLNAWLTLDEPIGGRADAIDLQTSSCGHSLLTHQKSLRADVELVGGRMSLGDEPFPLVADQLRLSLAPGERSRARLIGKFSNEPVQATLTIGSLEALLSPDTWPIDFEARGAGGRLRIDGRAGVVPGATMDATVELEAPHIGTLHPWTAGSPDAELPVQAKARLRFDTSNLVADAVALSLGESDLGGRAVWNHAGDPEVLSLNLRSNHLDLDDIGTVLPAMAEESGSTRADATDDATPPIPEGVTLPTVDLDLEFASVNGNRVDLQDFRLSGRLSKGLIEEARISVLIEDEIALQGGLDLDARQLPVTAEAAFSAENLDIGRVLRGLGVADDVRLRADALELLVTSDGTTPRQLLLNTLLQVELHGFNWKIPKSSSDTGAVTEDAMDISLGEVQLTMAPDQPTTWSSRGRVDNIDVELWMQTPSLNDTFGDIAELPITLVGAAGSDVVMIDTRVDRVVEGRLVAHVTLSGEVIDSQDRTLSELVSPLRDYQLQSDILLGEGALQLPNATMRLGSSRAEGRFDIDTSGPRTRLDVALHAPYLQTDDLLYWSGEFREAMVSGKESDHDAGGTEDPGENGGVLILARDFLGEFREDNDLDLKITVDQLRAGPDLLGGGELRLYVDEDDFNLKPLTISLPGGGVNAEYTASTRDGRLDARLKVQADALSYGGLLRLADPESEARGLLFLDTDISANTGWSTGAVPFELLFENADGAIDFAAWPENIEAGVLDLWTANVVLAVLPRPEAGKVSRLNCVATRFDIEDGVMKSQVTLLDTTDTIIRGRGTVNFADDELDLLIWPQAKREKFLSVATPVTITGSFDDFQVGVEPAGFVGTVIKWYTALIYVPFKWLTGERFPADGTSTCFDAMDWELTPGLHEYFLQRDFSTPPSIP